MINCNILGKIDFKKELHRVFIVQRWDNLILNRCSCTFLIFYFWMELLFTVSNRDAAENSKEHCCCHNYCNFLGKNDVSKCQKSYQLLISTSLQKKRSASNSFCSHINKLLSIMDNPEQHPLHHTLDRQWSTFSNRLLQIHCQREIQKNLSCHMPLLYTTHLCLMCKLWP